MKKLKEALDKFVDKLLAYKPNKKQKDKRNKPKKKV